MSRLRTRCVCIVWCVLAGALCAERAPVWAQAPMETMPTEPAAPQRELGEIRDAVEQARFEAAAERARSLLLRQSLTARERNDTLELLAIAQIAARHEALAQATLAELFARDPDHPQRMRDPGPNVEAFFARVRAAAHPSVTAQLQVAAMRDARARVLIEVRLGDGRDAVDTVHVLARSRVLASLTQPAPRSDPLLSRAPEGGQSPLENQATGEPETADVPVHVLAEVGLSERLVLVLPPAAPEATALDFYVEARAPSGYVLARDGVQDRPLRVRLDGAPPLRSAAQPGPLRRSWWLWTSIAIAVAGASVTGAVLAH